MKICKYCKTEIHDNEKSCSRCGASMFSTKCNNCATIFESNFCPTCGVKATAKPRHCNHCGNEYYSAFCPNCGRGSTPQQPLPNTRATYTNPAPKNKTSVGIVLLWIFFLPIMGCIAIAKSKKIKTPMKILLIALIVLFYIIGGLNNNEDSEQVTTGNATEVIATATFEIQD